VAVSLVVETEAVARVVVKAVAAMEARREAEAVEEVMVTAVMEARTAETARARSRGPS
jgi:hypothetical protein